MARCVNVFEYSVSQLDITPWLQPFADFEIWSSVTFDSAEMLVPLQGELALDPPI